MITHKKVVPELKQYNLFSDGSVKHDKRSVIIGGCLTQQDKIWISYRKKINYDQCSDSNYAELLAIHYGLEIAKEHDINSLKLFTDSIVSIEKIQAKLTQQHIHPKYELITKKIIEILPLEFSFKHITREKNNYADFLTHEKIESNYDK